MLAAVWDEVAVLRAHRIAHRDLRLANVFLAADGQVWLIDFGFSEMAAADVLLATDWPSSWRRRPCRSGRAGRWPGRSRRWTARRAAAQDRLHPWALSGATREALPRERAGLLDDVRARIGAAV